MICRRDFTISGDLAIGGLDDGMEDFKQLLYGIEKIFWIVRFFSFEGLGRGPLDRKLFDAFLILKVLEIFHLQQSASSGYV